MAGISPPKSDKKLPVYLKLVEVQQLFQSLEMVHPSPRSLRNELMFKFLVVTGMRRKEIVDLVWDQFDFANHTLRVHGKGNKERIIPLQPSVLPLFEHYRSTLSLHWLHGSEPAFTNRYNQAINPRGLHRIFKFELQRAGLPPGALVYIICGTRLQHCYCKIRRKKQI